MDLLQVALVLIIAVGITTSIFLLNALRQDIKKLS